MSHWPIRLKPHTIKYASRVMTARIARTVMARANSFGTLACSRPWSGHTMAMMNSEQ